MNSKLYGGIEGGGTKFVCAVGSDPDHILAEKRFPTTTPQETLSQVITFFKQFDLVAIGLATFGPLDLNPSSPSYGHITATPKINWANTDVLGCFRAAFSLPLVLESDVNAAAFGEYCWVAENQALDSLIYYTIGTGIGAGVILHGEIVHGLTHPEAGHVLLPHDRQRDPFEGVCPFHRDCFEGLASGPAISARWGAPANSLPDEHPAWELEAEYLAIAMVNTILTLSPQRLILGGGVMERRQLFPRVRQRVRELLNGYVASPMFSGALDTYIVPPALGNRSGVLGALALAQALTAGRPPRIQTIRV